MNVIMMNGHFVAMKTTIANKLSKTIGYPVVGTNQFDSLDPKISSDKRYELFYDLLEREFLQKRQNVILDATFSYQKWRQPVYDLCKIYGANLLIVRCECKNIEIIKKRLEYRKNALCKETSNFDDYLLSVARDEDPWIDDVHAGFSDIILFDSEQMRVKGGWGYSPFGTKIALILDSFWIELLKEKEQMCFS